MRDLRVSVIKGLAQGDDESFAFFAACFTISPHLWRKIKQSNGAFGSPRQSVFICLHKFQQSRKKFLVLRVKDRLVVIRASHWLSSEQASLQ
jgi:hypothetical protein